MTRVPLTLEKLFQCFFSNVQHEHIRKILQKIYGEIIRVNGKLCDSITIFKYIKNVHRKFIYDLGNLLLGDFKYC